MGQAGRFQTWLLTRLDSLLSEELHRRPPSELVRNRVLAGSTCLLLLLGLLALVAFPSLTLRLVVGLYCLSYVFVLVLLRRASSHLLPAFMVCTTALVTSQALLYFLRHTPYFGIHAGLMLQPALAVYLLGARRGLFVALILASMALLFPAYYTRLGAGALSPPDELFWPYYLCASFSFVSAWGLGSLHSSGLTKARHSLEQTLQELRDSQSQLLSVFESTDDPVFSLDTEGRLLTANSAARQMYLTRFGREPVLGQPYFLELEPEVSAIWRLRMGKSLTGQRQRFEEEHDIGGARHTFDISVNPVRGTEGRITGVTVFARNVTAARKEAELRLGEVYRTLVDVSRQAGMAEIATGILHNVGNTLNSVNVSTTLALDQLRQSRLPSLARLSTLLLERSNELGSFLTQDPQGKLLPSYISALSDQLQQEHTLLGQEMRSLSDSVDHIKSVISMQQKYARTAGAVEEVYLPQLIDEAMRLHAVSFERLGIRVERAYAGITPLLIDRHRLLQVLVNLLSNARDALISSENQDKKLIISIRPAPEDNRLLLQVTDNGVGIAPENAKRMFTQGFTTKKEGHGFGLHISALAATEMGGQLSCSSAGPGQGATFILVLPMTVPKES